MKVDCKGCNHENCVYVGMNNNTVCKDYVPLNPVSPNRSLVWLTKEDEKEIKNNCTTVACVLKAVKAKLKEKNT